MHVGASVVKYNYSPQQKGFLFLCISIIICSNSDNGSISIFQQFGQSL